MSRQRLTVSLPDDVAVYLRTSSNASAVVAEAVREYRTRALERELEAAYRDAAEESEAIDRAWESADSEIPE